MNEKDELWIFDPTTSLDQAPNDKTSPPLKLGSTIKSIGWAPAISRTPRSSQGSEGLTLGLSEPDGAPSASPRSTPTPAPSSQSDGPESRTSVTSSRSTKASSRATDVNGSEVAATLRGFGHGWQGQHMSTHAVMTGQPQPSGPAASPARTSPSQASAEAWEQTGTEPAPASPTPSLTLWSVTDLPPSSSKTYRDSSPVMEARTLERSSVAWASSGTGGPTGFSTLSSSECPSDDDGCSWSPSTLAQVLEPTAPQRFYLSARAATGILRRATRRGRELPASLQTALQALARSSPPSGTTATPSERRTLTGDTSKSDTPATDSVTTKSASATSPPETTRTSPTLSSSVRRLTPVECERLMGWPDGWTIARSWSAKPARVGGPKESTPAPSGPKVAAHRTTPSWSVVNGDEGISDDELSQRTWGYPSASTPTATDAAETES